MNDSHWIMRNLLLERLDPRARTIKGFHKSLCMVQGLDESYDGAVFVGYHSCAGTEGGVLNHTMLGKEIQNIYLNGEPTGETRLNAAYAGHFGVPVLVVAGDAAVVRGGTSGFSTTCRPSPSRTVSTSSAPTACTRRSRRQRIREAAAGAVAGMRSGPPRTGSASPYRLGIEWNSTTIAATCAMIPGVGLTGSRSVEFVTRTTRS